MTVRPDAACFRAAASRFPTGVTVVASRGIDGTPVGMTANSFTTVSTDPPTVLVSLARGRTWQAVTGSGFYTVNVLEAGDLALCGHFAGSPVSDGGPWLVETDGFYVLPHAVAEFACQVVRSIDVADHTIFVGEVRWCRHRDGSPLVFYASRFRNGPGHEVRPNGTATYPADGWAI